MGWHIPSFKPSISCAVSLPPQEILVMFPQTSFVLGSVCCGLTHRSKTTCSPSLPSFPAWAWLLILTCAPLLPRTSATVCAAAQGASLGSWLGRKMLQQDDTQGVVTGWEQASWYRLGEGEGLLTLMILLTSISCSLVMMGSAPKSKVFEKNRPDQAIFWKYERHLCSIGQSKCSLLVTCRSGLLNSHFSFCLW